MDEYIVHVAVAALGFLGGVMVGMSKSAIGGPLASAVLTVAGGTVIAASVREGITPPQLDRLGWETLWLALSLAVGLTIGMIILKKSSIHLPIKQ